jgi:RNA recognition motif-containing protein
MANIYIGNCSYDVTEEQLRELFATYGEVDSVNVIRDRDTGRPRGFAFVEMSDSAAAIPLTADDCLSTSIMN